ncbi:MULTISPECIES: hypothetical protein [unclassified Streptomyces]|uniref:hypothetical protein n=1 Tax=unclassified Streptomyces TaxID=2593676 RepID=UPI000DAE6E59|nr:MULTISPECIES: hypothetical protein [unclassified Streptomyces]PZT75799.1 hypothetical protein DNK56_20475 [Streptomyces sp. AC1-42W]PZT80246.1 hypothetical protein DNK55_12210 [Streptomyces sp. AC1-42T]
MRIVFFNGPVQNGDFIFADKPGKAVGIRAAAALNSLLGEPAVPHLWNTVTLVGDLRHQAELASGVDRYQHEHDLIRAKYPEGVLPAAGVFTDTDPVVARLAHALIRDRLETGVLSVERTATVVCSSCAHMAGIGSLVCKACGSTDLVRQLAPQLTAGRSADAPVLGPDDVHGRRLVHLENIARNVPDQLILSRTRAHGISLAPFGLAGTVLDPRAALHIAVLAAAERHGAERAFMLATETAVAHVAAYGLPFRSHSGIRLGYAVHGKVPYGDPLLPRLCEVHRLGEVQRTLFEEWFLPLYALRERGGIHPGKLPALVKFFRKVSLALRGPEAERGVGSVRRAVRGGDMGWLMDVRTVPHLLPAFPGRDVVGRW